MSYAFPEYFLDIANGRKKVIDLINVNITSCVAITQIVMKEMAGEETWVAIILILEELCWSRISMLMLPRFFSPTERRCGLVINVSSASADRPTPLLTVYSAAKVFVEYFSNVSCRRMATLTESDRKLLVTQGHSHDILSAGTIEGLRNGSENRPRIR